jgi:hypothetical protein
MHSSIKFVSYIEKRLKSVIAESKADLGVVIFPTEACRAAPLLRDAAEFLDILTRKGRAAPATPFAK